MSSYLENEERSRKDRARLIRACEKQLEHLKSLGIRTPAQEQELVHLQISIDKFKRRQEEPYVSPANRRKRDTMFARPSSPLW